MPSQEIVSVKDFCKSHSLEVTFINTLSDYGLIEMTIVEESSFIPVDQLPILEKIIRMHYDLEINLPGVETIQYLLQRVNNMQTEITDLKNRLRRYEDN